MSATIINIIIQIIAGIIGGNAAGLGMKNISLGTAGNTIAGALGGLGGGQLLELIIPALQGATGGGADIGSVIGQRSAAALVALSCGDCWRHQECHEQAGLRVCRPWLPEETAFSSWLSPEAPYLFTSTCGVAASRQLNKQVKRGSTLSRGFTQNAPKWGALSSTSAHLQAAPCRTITPGKVAIALLIRSCGRPRLCAASDRSCGCSRTTILATSTAHR